MQDQNYKNHSRFVPLYHFITIPGCLVLLVGSVYKFYKNYQMGVGGLMTPALLILAAIVLLLVALFARFFALKAQDRAIRAEENLRYFSITGKLFDSKLRMGQIIALRFAPDNEFVDLAHRAVKDNMKRDEIKKAIQNWKADHDRV
jgi:L-cystine uptake protein TcyP (sodium:dicarboxylate symporter family)